MKYIFNGITFTNKKVVDKYISSEKDKIIKKYGYDYKITKDNEYYEFIEGIINVHNNKIEKTGTGIFYFYFITDYFGKDQLRIGRTDGTNIDCSYMYSKITTGYKYMEVLNLAMRMAVVDQIIEYKKEIGKNGKCVICGIETTKYEADHIIPFKVIKNKFLETENHIPTEFYKDTNHTCVLIFRKEDEAFSKRWQEYHKNESKYQVLCSLCNQKKGSKLNYKIDKRY